MKTIWKFLLPMAHQFQMEMPAAAVVLAVQVQGKQPTLWAAVESDAPREFRRFIIAGTGRALPDAHGRYLGTWQENGYVWHLFEGPAA